jgi:hypothetical protein
MDVTQRDRLYLAREEAPDGLQIARSQGSFLFDQHGKKYLDFTAGCCVGNFGWGNEEIRAAVRDFDGPTYVHPDYLSLRRLGGAGRRPGRDRSRQTDEMLPRGRRLRSSRDRAAGSDGSYGAPELRLAGWLLP